MTTSSNINYIAEPKNKSILLNGIFSSMALGHFSVDVLNGTRATLLTFLSGILGLNNASLAAINTAYIWVSAATQPLFGWLADRIGTRWLTSLGILWMAVLFILAINLQGTFGIVLLILASLGSAAFHPAGATEATLVGREAYAGRETTATSLFFFFGQLGWFMGPLMSGLLLDSFGVYGLLVLGGLLMPVGLNAAWQLRLRSTKQTTVRMENILKPVQLDKLFIILLAVIGAFQSWAQQNMITFIPKYLSDLGQTASTYGLVSGLFMGGSAIGNVVGGSLADQFGKRRVAVIVLFLSSIPIYLISTLGWSAWLYLLIPLAGGLTGAVHSIVMVLAQRSLPMGMGMASGLAMGFIFSAGALGTLLSGPLADAWGWPPVFQLTSMLVLVGAGLAFFLRE